MQIEHSQRDGLWEKTLVVRFAGVRRTLSTSDGRWKPGIPMVVVNRGGKEPELDISKGESAVSRDGERLFSFTAPTGRIFYVDWDRRQRFREVPR